MPSSKKPKLPKHTATGGMAPLVTLGALIQHCSGVAAQRSKLAFFGCPIVHVWLVLAGRRPCVQLFVHVHDFGTKFHLESSNNANLGTWTWTWRFPNPSITATPFDFSRLSIALRSSFFRLLPQALGGRCLSGVSYLRLLV